MTAERGEVTAGAVPSKILVTLVKACAADVKKSISHHLPGRKTEIADLVGSPSLTKVTPPPEYGQVEEVRPL